jgi:hypothetical protein
LHENARKCSYFIDPIHFREFLEIFHFSPISINISHCETPLTEKLSKLNVE